MSSFPQDDLDRLAERVVSGEVVFFVGAGFSLDSEGNSASRLIERLLVRFDAMTQLLQSARTPDKTRAAGLARALRRGLIETFSLSREGKPATVEDCLAERAYAESLAGAYFNINDWMTSAFTQLIAELKLLKRGRQKRLIADLNELERSRVGGDPAGHSARPWPIDLAALLASGGKAFFLETMGFADPEVMAGDPCADDLATVSKSYRGRLRPRHHVIARLAREGLASTLMTTNFDLLLEGACRLAGLALLPVDGLPPPRPAGLPPATFDFCRRIASATQFFGRGDDRRAANLLKIHGCAESYRRARSKGTDPLQAYLPAMVFTFREIQNWREDSWSRDLLRTLLRTRTIVFCGYGGGDPVLHDTIRTVYEEMARRRPVAAGQTVKDKAGRAAQTKARQAAKSKNEAAPAFFLGASGKTEFYGIEILRAASRAVGGDPDLANHPNYLRFHLLSRGGPRRFPELDEVMRWLFHLVFRRRQLQALTSDLGRIATLLLMHPCPPVEREAVIAGFQALVEAEKKAALRWGEHPYHRFQFERMVGWTERFQVRLLREFAFAEAALRSPGPGLEIERFRRSLWYYPAADHLEWAAWGAVVELALRRRLACWRGESDRWQEDIPWVAPGDGSHAALLYSHGADHPTPTCLSIRLRSGRRELNPAVRGACRGHRTWELDYAEIPWRRTAHGATPGADTLWAWAHRPTASLAGGAFDRFP